MQHDGEFVEIILSDLEDYLQEAKVNRVLLFPAVQNRYRYLTHQAVAHFPSLASFSVGEGPHRRTVVCLKRALQRGPKGIELLKSGPPGRASKGRGKEMNDGSFSPSLASGTHKPEVLPSRKISLAAEAKQKKCLAGRGRARNKKPEQQLYVPRGRRELNVSSQAKLETNPSMKNEILTLHAVDMEQLLDAARHASSDTTSCHSQDAISVPSSQPSDRKDCPGSPRDIKISVESPLAKKPSQKVDVKLGNATHKTKQVREERKLYTPKCRQKQGDKASKAETENINGSPMCFQLKNDIGGLGSHQKTDPLITEPGIFDDVETGVPEHLKLISQELNVVVTQQSEQLDSTVLCSEKVSENREMEYDRHIAFQRSGNSFLSKSPSVISNTDSQKAKITTESIAEVTSFAVDSNASNPDNAVPPAALHNEPLYSQPVDSISGESLFVISPSIVCKTVSQEAEILTEPVGERSVAGDCSAVSGSAVLVDLCDTESLPSQPVDNISMPSSEWKKTKDVLDTAGCEGSNTCFAECEPSETGVLSSYAVDSRNIKTLQTCLLSDNTNNIKTHGIIENPVKVCGNPNAVCCILTDLNTSDDIQICSTAENSIWNNTVLGFDTKEIPPLDITLGETSVIAESLNSVSVATIARKNEPTKDCHYQVNVNNSMTRQLYCEKEIGETAIIQSFGCDTRSDTNYISTKADLKENGGTDTNTSHSNIVDKKGEVELVHVTRGEASLLSNNDENKINTTSTDKTSEVELVHVTEGETSQQSNNDEYKINSTIDITSDVRDSISSKQINETMDTDSWDAIFDDEGECLNPDAMKELEAHVGKVKICHPKKDKIINYLDYQPKDMDDDMEAYCHVIEICDFPAEFLTRDIMFAFKDYIDRGFDIKWVDDTHALGVFSSAVAAQDALKMINPMMKLKPLSQASSQSRSKVRRCKEFLQPYKARPETSAMAARRLVTGALGLTPRLSKEQRDHERMVLTKAKEKKRQDRIQKESMWDGNIGKCVMDGL